MSVILRVYGVPGPQGSKKSFGPGRMVETSKKVGPWRDAVVHAVLAKRTELSLLRGPVAVSIVFYLPSTAKSRAWERKHGGLMPHASRPDIDKLQRSTHDALVMSGLIEDDGCIVEDYAIKFYASESELGGATIRVESWRADNWVKRFKNRP